MDVVVLISPCHADPISLLLAEGQKFFKQRRIKTVFINQPSSHCDFCAVHMDDGIRRDDIPVWDAEIIIHIAPGGQDDFMFFAELFYGFESAFRDTPGCVV